MTRSRVLLLAVVAALCGTVPAVAADDGSGAGMLFRIHDQRVVESSGLALSRTHPGLAYTMNDSGSDARVLVLSMRDGSVVGEAVLAGVTADDVEALAPAPRGRLVVGDIGDNFATRDSVEAYVIDEPGAGRTRVRPRTVSLAYADGPRDAEAMVVVGPTIYVVSKEAFGGVFAAPLRAAGGGDRTLRRVAAAPSVVTDAALLPDGDVAMRDYRRGYVVSLPSWRVRRSFSLPRVPQGETVAAALHGRRILVGSEGSHSPVYEVSVPRSTPVARSEPAPAQASSGPGTHAGVSQPAGQEDLHPRVRPTGYVVAVAAALVVGVVVRWWRRRRGRPPIRIR